MARPEEEKIDFEHVKSEIVVLNVGGIKYETYRSTLTHYPDTLLGTMFSDRNRHLNRPTNATSNEYFIDRDGHLFRYILQFYRTGTIYPLDPANSEPSMTTLTTINSLSGVHSQALLKEIYAEIDFFQIPFPPIESNTVLVLPETERLKKIHSLTAQKVDLFVYALRDVLYEAISHFEFSISFSFNRGELDENTYWNQYLARKPFIQIIRPFAWCGYVILDQFGQEIGKWLEREVPGLKFHIEKHQPSASHVMLSDTRQSYRVILSVPDDWYRDELLAMSCLLQYDKTEK
ncbi:hypothetical protein G9A89_009673 [Geosiphon pyriformis]|nr:hypothetical protein G9A89_009673 [Geosiphon pyriformis]